MRKILSAAAVMILLTSAYYQKAGSHGGWTFKSYHCSANKFKPHNETWVAFDTTRTPNPKFIIDFNKNIPKQSGLYKVIKGKPAADNEIGIGVGCLSQNKLVFYSSTGIGQQDVEVLVSGGKTTLRGSNIELANQTNSADKSTLTFNITQ